MIPHSIFTQMLHVEDISWITISFMKHFTRKSHVVDLLVKHEKHKLTNLCTLMYINNDKPIFCLEIALLQTSFKHRSDPITETAIKRNAFLTDSAVSSYQLFLNVLRYHFSIQTYKSVHQISSILKVQDCTM